MNAVRTSERINKPWHRGNEYAVLYRIRYSLASADRAGKKMCGGGTLIEGLTNGLDLLITRKHKDSRISPRRCWIRELVVGWRQPLIAQRYRQDNRTHKISQNLHASFNVNNSRKMQLLLRKITRCNTIIWKKNRHIINRNNIYILEFKIDLSIAYIFLNPKYIFLSQLEILFIFLSRC